MKLSKTLNDQAVLSELGKRLAQYRITLSLTQEELARRVGLGKRTIERIENGGSTQLTGVVRVMRELDLLEILDSLLPEAEPRPMDLLKLHGKARQRASRVKKKPAKPWIWEDKT